jgi:hypothetical protein
VQFELTIASCREGKETALFFLGADQTFRMSFTPLGAEAFNGDEVAPFFGFLGAASALIFACKILQAVS